MYILAPCNECTFDLIFSIYHVIEAWNVVYTKSLEESVTEA